ncbi:MAG: YjjG family noncanonical pyrimidine nucleotidase [Bacteroidetes bacterium]|jgi:putative hydrolase of the HAD superfamily|nr:YjjG family noncanonical pyrimidine nucleotidase [Bacteroidota bacterium]
MKLKKSYTHLLFDLDHTLWDTDKNAGLALIELYEENNLKQYGISDYQEFVDKYTAINNRMWTDYSLGKIKKSYLRTGRFEQTLKHFRISDEKLVEQLADFFVNRTPLKKHLLPHATELLNHLQGRYELAIVTNGFAEAQHTKLKSSDIAHFFSQVVISEEVGYHKPDPRIFIHTAEILNAPVEDCLMIGDNAETDIAGAIAAGMDCVYLNRTNVIHDLPVTFEADNLQKLIKLL